MMWHLMTFNLLSSIVLRIISPNITLYPVWDGELGISQIRLICALSGFFPNKLTVEWYKDDHRLTNDRQNERNLISADGEDKTFSRTTEIFPNMEEWKKGSNYTCKSEHNGKVLVKTTDICQGRFIIDPVTYQINN